MHLVQLLLPLGADQSAVAQIRAELTERFGGITVFGRGAAGGHWNDGTGHGEVVVAEVMTAIWDPVWWRSYRARLERRFVEQEIVIRAVPVERV